MIEQLLDIGALILQVTLIMLMVGSILNLVDMFFDGYVKISKAIILLLIAGLSIYGLNSITGY